MHQALNTLSKAQVISALKILGLSYPGDYARNGKHVYVNLLCHGTDPDEVRAAIDKVLGSTLPTSVAPALIAGPAAVMAAAPEAPPPDVKVIGKSTLGKRFGIGGKYKDAPVTLWDDPDAPTLDPLYRFDPEILFDATREVEEGGNIWLCGPASTGKTEFVKNLCAGLGRAFVRVSMDDSLERYELIGGERAVNGSQVYKQGVILKAMQRPGAVVLLDELGFGRAANLAALHGVLEPNGSYTVPETGQVIRRAPGQLFMAADNSNGSGDITGQYVGVKPQNKAFRSRFAMYLEFTYLKPEVEAEVLSARTGCNKAVAEEIVRFLGVCRTAVETSQLEIAPVLREAMALCRALKNGIEPRRAFERCVVTGAEAEAREVLQQLWKANMDTARLEVAMSNKVAETVAP
jgi:nitric oxide reductase NorQ protein